MTSRIRVMTNLVVMPYRNPFLLAKSMTALDVISRGRATFVLGAGYLRSEFAALGVDFEQRNELFDEAVDIVQGLWESPQEFRYAGSHFSGFGVALAPPPVQRPHPPLWVGGNTRRARRRVAAWADGWAPLTVGGPTMSTTTRTSVIESDEQLAGYISEIKAMMAAAGRDPAALDVASGGVETVPEPSGIAQQIDHVIRLRELGVTWAPARFDRTSLSAATESLTAFGENVIAKIRIDEDERRRTEPDTGRSSTHGSS